MKKEPNPRRLLAELVKQAQERPGNIRESLKAYKSGIQSRAPLTRSSDILQTADQHLSGAAEPSRFASRPSTAGVSAWGHENIENIESALGPVRERGVGSEMDAGGGDGSVAGGGRGALGPVMARGGAGSGLGGGGEAVGDRGVKGGVGDGVRALGGEEGEEGRGLGENDGIGEGVPGRSGNVLPKGGLTFLDWE